MRRHSLGSGNAFGLLGGFGAAVAALSFLIGASLPVATASAPGAPVVVDRTLKGDRLPTLAPAARIKSPAREKNQPVRLEQPLPVGCESIYSSIGRASKGIAGRCLS